MVLEMAQALDEQEERLGIVEGQMSEATATEACQLAKAPMDHAQPQLRVLLRAGLLEAASVGVSFPTPKRGGTARR
jgi:hypothetical protein